jgi:hypothetical protein
VVVSKTATTSYKYEWDIDKTITGTSVDNQAMSVTATYSVVATAVATDYRVGGTIVVENDSEVDVDIDSVVDRLGGDLSCAVTGSTGVLTAGSSRTFTYECSGPGVDDTIDENLAEVEWSLTGQDAVTSQATAAVDWESASVIDQIVDIVDDNGTTGDTSDDLRIEDADALDPTTSSTTYSVTFAPEPGTCTDRDNTARVYRNNTGTALASDDASIEVCNPTNDYGFTIGYWQNPNGQRWLAGKTFANVGFTSYSTTLPTSLFGRTYTKVDGTRRQNGSCPVSGGCYVWDVIKAANSSSTAETMYRAQFMATVLNVRNSDGALGNVNIWVDGYNLPGDPDCCMSVNELLAAAEAYYAGALSGGIDSTERAYLLAFKDVFDDINNNIAPTCLIVIT